MHECECHASTSDYINRATEDGVLIIKHNSHTALPPYIIRQLVNGTAIGQGLRLWEVHFKCKASS